VNEALRSHSGWALPSLRDRKLLDGSGVRGFQVSLLVATIGDHHGSRRGYLTTGAVLLTLTGIGIVLLPAGGWLWAVLIGVWVGITFPSLMTLPLDVGASAHEVGAMAAMMLGLGYTISSLAPFLFGAVRDLTGSFTPVLWLIVANAVLLILASTAVPKRHTRPQPQPASSDPTAPITAA
jgi:CP family cyanate transporter-like MFS transporter